MQHLVKSVLMVFLATGLLGISGCGDGDEPLSLEATSWRLQGWSVSSLYPGDFEITAQFVEGKMTGKAAVNNYTGPYDAGVAGADGTGEFSAGPLASTKMAGPEPAMRAESTYFALLEQARSYRLDDSGLTLLDGNGNELLIYEPVTSG